MSASVWESLSDLMVRVAMVVDFLRLVMFWSALLAFVVWLVLLFLKAVVHSGGHGPDLALGESFQSSMSGRLEEMANIAISRRQRVRKCRHHHAKPASQKS